MSVQSLACIHMCLVLFNLWLAGLRLHQPWDSVLADGPHLGPFRLQNRSAFAQRSKHPSSVVWFSKPGARCPEGWEGQLSGPRRLWLVQKSLSLVAAQERREWSGRAEFLGPTIVARTEKQGECPQLVSRQPCLSTQLQMVEIRLQSLILKSVLCTASLPGSLGIDYRHCCRLQAGTRGRSSIMVLGENGAGVEVDQELGKTRLRKSLQVWSDPRWLLQLGCLKGDLFWMEMKCQAVCFSVKCPTQECSSHPSKDSAPSREGLVSLSQ